MKKRYRFVTLFVFASFLLGWLSNDVLELPIRELEKEINLDGEKNWSFHSALEDTDRHGFRFPGYLIGIEKTDKKFLGMDDNSDVFDFTKLKKSAIAPIRSALNDNDRLFLSHIVKYDRNSNIDLGISSDVFYSVYDPKMVRLKPLPFGLKALNQLYSDIDSVMKKEKYSHLFVVCMGWNTPQIEAIGDINSLIGGLMREANQHSSDSKFRPLVLGVTWPSQSKFSRYNYLSKSYDADELGVIWINELIKRVIDPLNVNHELKVILLGHSLGARALTMGLFASTWSESGYKLANSIDALVGYAPAFSINRFIAGRGIEGAPFADFKELDTKLFFSWSEHDSAMRIGQAYLTKHMGGESAAKLAAEYPSLFHKFSSIEIDRSLIQKPESKIAYIDMTEIAKYKSYYNSSGGAHGDIFRPESSDFFWKLLQLYNLD